MENKEKTKYETLLERPKENIINWYPVDQNAKVLQISNKEDKLKIEQVDNVISIENAEELKDIDEKFDYIIMINKLNSTVTNFEKIIDKLNFDGKILLIEDNRLSIKNICEVEQEENNNYSIKEIEEILENYDLKYRKNYYVLHDYKKTNVIFTDKHLPDKETIRRNITFYSENSIINHNENDIYDELLEIDINLFKIFANSFFIECSKTELADNQIELVSYSNIRKEEYKIKTTIKGNALYKTYANGQAKKHIEQIKNNINIMKNNNINTLDSYEDNNIISQYQEGRQTLDKYLINKVANNETEEVKQIITKFYEELKEKLIKTETTENVFDKYNLEYEKKDIENLNFVKYGLWDLIFQNTFYIEDKFFFYDQEWIEENLPVEYIMYRAMKYCKTLQDLLTKEYFYDMIGINNKNVELFDALDNRLQQNTRSEENWEIHTRENSVMQKISDIRAEKEKMYQESLKLLNEKDARIKFLEENMEKTCAMLQEKEQQINMMENSTSWKITKPLRELKKPKKGEENESKR